MSLPRRGSIYGNPTKSPENNVKPSHQRSGSSSGSTTPRSRSESNTPTESKSINEIPIYKPEDESLQDTQILIKAQIRKQGEKRFGSISEPQKIGEWQPLWAGKITENARMGKGIINIGKVIGETFEIQKQTIERKSPGEQKLIKENSSYRFDWAPDKGKHINSFEVPIPNKDDLNLPLTPRYEDRRDHAYMYGDIPKIPKKNRTQEQQEIIELGQEEVLAQWNDLTRLSLDEKKSMPSIIAEQVLGEFTNSQHDPPIKNYFIQFSDLLRPVLDCARIAYLRNDSQKKISEDAFSGEEIHEQISGYLTPLWEKSVSNILLTINHIHIIEMEIKNLNVAPSFTTELKRKLSPLDNILDKQFQEFSKSSGLSILISELKYSLSGQSYRLKIFSELDSVFGKVSTADLKTLCSYLKNKAEEPDRKIIDTWSSIMINSKAQYVDELSRHPEEPAFTSPPKLQSQASISMMLTDNLADAVTLNRQSLDKSEITNDKPAILAPPRTNTNDNDNTDAKSEDKKPESPRPK
jgi:hypothetical protein